MIGAALVSSGIAVGIVVESPRWVGLTMTAALVAIGGFAIFEAAKGWCVLRALGIRTWM